MTQQDPKLVELPVRLSTSKLWTIQENYFASKGILAWKDEVPYYISSNAFIGHRYAMLVICYIQDMLKKAPHSQEPFYILETGAGTGKFSFYFLQAFKSLLPRYGLENQPFCYIISDVIQKNIEFCQKNVSFSPYIQNNELDFALFNVAKDEDFHLITHDKRYSDLNSHHPLIIIANYTFDCIKQDAFIYKENKMFELQLGIKSRFKNFDIDKSLHLSDLKLQYESKEIDMNHYYENESFNAILKNYQDYCKEQLEKEKEKEKETEREKEAKNKNQKNHEKMPEEIKVLLPISALEFMHHMHSLTKGNYFLISGDKGISLIEHMPLVSLPNVMSFDGCFSFMVNFHAMGEYSKALGGDSLLTQHNNDFKLGLFCQGATFEQLSNTKAYFNTELESLGPNEFCNLFSEFDASSYRFAMPSLLSFLRLSEWDPQVYAVIHDRIIELIPSAQCPMKKEIEKELVKIKRNIYDLPIGDDIYNLLGIYYQTVKNDVLAIECYEKSIELFKDKCASHNNLAILYEKQKNIEKAIYHYRKSYEIDKKNKRALNKAKQLEGEITTLIFIPFLKSLFVLGLMVLGIYLLNKS